jgi:hypothetical protein
VVGVLTYRIDGYGGTLVADDLLTTGPLGRALLLRFLAGHAGQVSQVEVTVAADESPELWAADLAASVETRIAFPRASAPMGRILAVDALRDMASGPGVVGVEVVDDHFLAGRYRLDGTGGRLAVDTLPERSDVPVATLTAAGLSALAFGVYQPEDVVVRGFGVVPPAAVPRLRALFPPCTPYLFGPG